MAIMDSCSSHDLSSHGWPNPGRGELFIPPIEKTSESCFFEMFGKEPGPKLLSQKKRCVKKKHWCNWDVWDGNDMNGMISNTKCETHGACDDLFHYVSRELCKSHQPRIRVCDVLNPAFFHRKKIWDKRLLWITKNKLLDLLELMHSEDATNVSTLYRGIVQDIPRLKFKFPSSNDMKWLLKSIYRSILLYCIYQMYVYTYIHTTCSLEDFSWSLSLRPLLPASRRKHEDKPT